MVVFPRPRSHTWPSEELPWELTPLPSTASNGRECQGFWAERAQAAGDKADGWYQEPCLQFLSGPGSHMRSEYSAKRKEWLSYLYLKHNRRKSHLEFQNGKLWLHGLLHFFYLCPDSAPQPSSKRTNAQLGSGAVGWDSFLPTILYILSPTMPN